MSGMVQVAVARDLTEAEEIQTILRSAGIHSELEVAVEQHPTQLDDSPQKVLSFYNDNDTEQIVSALVHADVGVRAFSIDRPSLEDVFVSLTGEGFDVSG